MRVKKGAIIAGLKIEMRIVLRAAEIVWKKHDIEEGVTVTSGLDGVHSAGSYHPFGYAVDLRTRYFNGYQVRAVAEELQDRLWLTSNRYQVIVELTHIHVEYDLEMNVKQVEIYAPFARHSRPLNPRNPNTGRFTKK